MIIDILKYIVNDIQQKSNKQNDNHYEEYKKQLDNTFGNFNPDSCKVIKEYKSNT